MKKLAMFMIFMLVSATLVASRPFQPEGRKEEREMLLTELLILKELFQPSSRKTAAERVLQDIVVEQLAVELEERETVSERVQQIVVEELGVTEEQVTPEASFTEDLGADSLDVVELVMAMEEEFEIDIPDEEAENLDTVQKFISYVQNNSQ